MKAKEQIVEWLKSQEWYDAFASNLRNFYNCDVKEHIDKLGEGKWPFLIDYAFDWEDTDERSKFWSDADKKFLQWLNSDEQTAQSSDRWIFDRGSKEAPFYMVYAEGKSSPTFKHGSMEEATKEADRLAKSLNTRTYVLAAVMEIRPEIVTSAVGIDDMEHQVDNPF